jgi:hypothetical protein
MVRPRVVQCFKPAVVSGKKKQIPARGLQPFAALQLDVYAGRLSGAGRLRWADCSGHKIVMGRRRLEVSRNSA